MFPSLLLFVWHLAFFFSFLRHCHGAVLFSTFIAEQKNGFVCAQSLIYFIQLDARNFHQTPCICTVINPFIIHDILKHCCVVPPYNALHSGIYMRIHTAAPNTHTTQTNISWYPTWFDLLTALLCHRCRCFYNILCLFLRRSKFCFSNSITHISPALLFIVILKKRIENEMRTTTRARQHSQNHDELRTHTHTCQKMDKTDASALFFFIKEKS